MIVKLSFNTFDFKLTEIFSVKWMAYIYLTKSQDNLDVLLLWMKVCVESVSSVWEQSICTYLLMDAQIWDM